MFIDQKTKKDRPMDEQEISPTEEETRSFLISLPIFSSFNVEEIAILSKHMSFLHLEQDTPLFNEGDQGNFMGFIVSGLLEVQKMSDSGKNIPLVRLTKGSAIGEMALIDRSPRSATVIARQPTTMVTLTDKGFTILAEKYPMLGIKVMQKIARLLSLNMRRTTSKLADLM